MAQQEAKVVTLNTPEVLSPGDDVYLSDQYYIDTGATLLDVPRYGWQVKACTDGVCQIEYQRPNLKLLMSIMCECKYLKREV